SECRMKGLINELAVKAEVARERQDDVIVLEPGESVDHETKRHSIDAGRDRSADRKGEGSEHPRQHDLLAGRRDAVLRKPVDSHARDERRGRVAGHGEVDLRRPTALPWQETGVAEAERVARRRSGRERRRWSLILER